MRPFQVFGLSWLAAHAFWLIERMASISWDFHPDAVAYIQEYDQYTDDLANLPNNLYFFISGWLSGNVALLIEINVLLYALTNAVGCWTIRRAARMQPLNRHHVRVLSMVFLLQLYRLHLGVHVLKDTIIIFLLVLVVVGVPRRLWLALPLLLATRVSAALYLIALLPRRVVIALFLISLVLILPQQDLLEFLIARNEVDMGGRDFNSVPNFDGLGMVGTLVRGVCWPALLLSGGFLGLSPALSFAPIAAELAMGRMALLRLRMIHIPWLPIFASLALIAVLVNSFTAYLRYGYTLICVMPLLSLKLNGKTK